MKPETTYAKNIKGIFPELVRKPFGKCSRTGTIILLCLVLIAIILAVYMQVGNHQFLNLDDGAYVTNNPHVVSGITGKNIRWALTSVYEANWHPITWLSHMADVQLFGMNPRGHHLTSVAIHIVSSLLLFLLLGRLTGALWQSFFVSALFALHPLHVESVAWVAERKDVLSALFWFLTLLFYAEYVAKQKTVLYILTLFSFVLGLMSKPMLVTLPIAMLLMDFWPLNRFRCGVQGPGLRQFLNKVSALIKEKIPFFVCSIFSALVTFYAQHNGGAITRLNVMPLQLRFENAMVAYVKYLGKTLWPHDLAILYPFPSFIPLWQVLSSLFILLFLSAAAIRTWRRHPYVAVGWLWFLVTLVPVIGLVQVGTQSMADRYTYIPLIGLFIMVAWGISDLTKGLRYRQFTLALFAGAAIIASAALTWHQLSYWRGSIPLYRHTIRVTADNPVINFNLGAALQTQGDLDAAILEYREVLRINSFDKSARDYLRVALRLKGDRDAAIQLYREMLRINPNNKNAHINLGLAFAGKGDLDSAIHEYQEALRISPNDTDVHFKLKLALAQKKMQGEAKK